MHRHAPLLPFLLRLTLACAMLLHVIGTGERGNADTIQQASDGRHGGTRERRENDEPLRYSEFVSTDASGSKRYRFRLFLSASFSFDDLPPLPPLDSLTISTPLPPQSVAEWLGNASDALADTRSLAIEFHTPSGLEPQQLESHYSPHSYSQLSKVMTDCTPRLASLRIVTAPEAVCLGDTYSPTYPRHLQTLEIHGSDFGFWLRGLQSTPSLTAIALVKTPPDAGYAAACKPLGNEDAEKIARLSQLRELSLDGCLSDLSVLAPIAECDELEALHVANTRVDSFPNLRALRQLTAEHCALSIAGMKAMFEGSQVELLRLNYCTTDSPTLPAEIEPPPSVETLAVLSRDPESALFSLVRRAPRTVRCEVEFPPSVAVRPFARQVHALHLAGGDCQGDRIDEVSLAEMQPVVLSVVACDVSYAGFVQMCSISSVRRLRMRCFDECDFGGQDSEARDTAERQSHLSHLTIERYTGDPESLLKAISRMDDLESVQLRYCSIVGPELHHLTKLRRLKELTIERPLGRGAQAVAPDSIIKAVSQCRAVESLTLSGIGARDDDIQVLSQMDALRELDLQQNDFVTIEGLAGLKYGEALSYLGLLHTGVRRRDVGSIASASYCVGSIDAPESQ